VKALFDFESGGPSELSFVTGEVLTVVEKVCIDYRCDFCKFMLSVCKLKIIYD